MRAQHIAEALDLRRVGRNTWRGPCPVCGGRQRFQLRQGRTGPLVWCFGGCGSSGVIRALREANLWPQAERPEWSPEERRARAEARRRDEQDARPARYFGLAAECLAEEALSRISDSCPERAVLTDLLGAVRRPRLLEEFRCWRQREPRLTAAMLRAGENLDRRRQTHVLPALLIPQEKAT